MKMDKWISTKKEVPSAGTQVLVVAKDWGTDEPFLVIAYPGHTGVWYIHGMNYLRAEDILVWQPLPNIPDRFYPIKEEDETIS